MDWPARSPDLNGEVYQQVLTTHESKIERIMIVYMIIQSAEDEGHQFGHLCNWEVIVKTTAVNYPDK